jgi:hypothetical protein
MDRVCREEYRGGSSRKGYTYGYSGIEMNGKNAVVVIKEMQIAKRGTSTA